MMSGVDISAKKPGKPTPEEECIYTRIDTHTFTRMQMHSRDVELLVSLEMPVEKGT